MKNILLLIGVISMISLSCDGRKTKKESLSAAISMFKLNNTSIQKVTYTPEAYVEIVTDTLISKNIKVSIRNYSLLEEHILFSDVNHIPSKNIHYQRVFESEINITMHSKVIFSTCISAQQLRAIDSNPFWENATLQHTWVNQELSTLGDIKLDISFVNPKNDAYKVYRLSVDSSGQHTFNLIEGHI